MSMTPSNERPIKIVVIIGSVRPNNYTAMAVQVVKKSLERDERIGCTIIDPASLDLPLPGLSTDHPDTLHIRKLVSEATGVIVATPEYHGSFSSVIKLVIENLGFPSVLAAKPVALLGVAGGAIGAIKSLEALRGVCSHVGAIVLPGPVSIAKVRSVFDKDGNCLDEFVEKRLAGLGQHLIDYIGHAICPAIALEAMVREEAA